VIVQKCLILLLFLCFGAESPRADILARLLRNIEKTVEQRRHDYDGDFAGRLLIAVELSPTSRPTNWNEVYPGLKPEAWIRWEQLFLKYPEAERGFKKSLYEKYVFIEPGIRVPDQSWSTGGDLVMLQVNPPKGRTRRFGIWRSDAGYQILPFPESEIQKWFAKAGRPIPSPPDNLPPATPPGWKSESETFDFWERYGAWLATFVGSALVVAFALMFFRFWRKVK
jgi:hypothetical protein